MLQSYCNLFVLFLFMCCSVMFRVIIILLGRRTVFRDCGTDSVILEYISYVNRITRVFDHAQNERIYIILHMRKLSFRQLLSIGTFYTCITQRLFLQKAKTLSRPRGYAGRSEILMSVYARRHIFTWRGPYNYCSASPHVCSLNRISP